MVQTDNTVAQILADWTNQFSYSDISDDVRDEANRCIVDTVGVSVGGLDQTTAHLSRALAYKNYAAGPCHVLGSTKMLSTPGAAFCNGVAAHVLDFDDVSYEGMVHASAVVWPAIFAAGEQVNASGCEVVTAFVAAVEAEYALGRAMTHDLFWRGWWTTGLLGSIGAAIGVAKVMALDCQTTSQAINIAASQATGPYALVGSPVKPYACGRAAEAGVLAAQAASRGLEGPRESFEHSNGFIAMYGNHQFVPEELNHLGIRFVLNTSRVAFKRYPVCSAGQAAIEALELIVSKNNIKNSEIVEVHCNVTSDIAHYMQVDDPMTVTEAQFCLAFCLACILRFGELTPQQLSIDVINDPDIKTEMKKVRLVYSKKLDELCKQRDDYQQSAEVTIKTSTLNSITELVAAPSGTSASPMSNEQIENKFINCVRQCYPEPQVLKLLNRVKSISELSSIRSLFYNL